MALIRNRVFLIAVVLVMLGLTGRWAWSRYGELVRSDPRFQISETNLTITEPPAWVRSDVKKAAILAGDLDQVSLLDRDAVDKVAAAFQVQTWVSSVDRVIKSPSGVDVDLTYRKPVALVEITVNQAHKLQPIDREGVLLPGAEFAQSEANEYLRLAVQDPRLHGLIDGTAWPDDRVLQGALVAELLSGHREKLGLFRVQMIRDGGTRNSVASFEIQTHSGTRVIWGTAPGYEILGEAPTEARLKVLDILHESLASDSDEVSCFDIRTGAIVKLDADPAMAHEENRGGENPWGIPLRN